VRSAQAGVRPSNRTTQRPISASVTTKKTSSSTPLIVLCDNSLSIPSFLALVRGRCTFGLTPSNRRTAPRPAPKPVVLPRLCPFGKSVKSLAARRPGVCGSRGDQLAAARGLIDAPRRRTGVYGNEPPLASPAGRSVSSIERCHVVS
jgi:hypothetical protein